MPIPEYPLFEPIGLHQLDEMRLALSANPDGLSELTFANLYLFRGTYGYEISKVGKETLIVAGSRDGKRFVTFPCAVPDRGVVDSLMEGRDYIKNLSERLADASRCRLECWGYAVEEDRDNFDYIYLRTDLAELTGRHYHKKRNLVNAFVNSYEYSHQPLDESNLKDALSVLESWREAKGIEGDTAAAREGLERFRQLGMSGAVYYVEGKPAGFVLGEPVARGRSFAIHFEKALEGYKGIYQFMNQAFAQTLPRHYHIINREQDLGDEGLRQAKMTYRPCGFVKKYKAIPRRHEEICPCEEPQDAAPGYF
jgi:hypothetical protein